MMKSKQAERLFGGKKSYILHIHTFIYAQLLTVQMRRIKETSRKTDADKAKLIDLCYLCERPWSALDAELCVAELTVAGVGRRQPLL